MRVPSSGSSLTLSLSVSGNRGLMVAQGGEESCFHVLVDDVVVDVRDMSGEAGDAVP
ncbi:hypothetical protein ACFYRL_34225 [Streptomyces goshikiensis]|uniref:hypothetical protein n=1 Tax=Streptomyces goshikiensis TaxID=1942 RepID=UPI003694523B